MKNRKINFIKLGILLFGVSIILWNCVEEPFVENEPNIPIQINAKTVSFKDAIAHFTAKKEKIKLKRTYAKGTENPLEVTPNWNTLEFKDISYTDANLTTANAEINRDGKYSSQLYFINVNNHIRNVIFTIYKDEIDANGNIINGRIYLNDLEGKFIDAYRIENGIFTKRFIVKTPIQKASFLPLFLFQSLQDSDDNVGGEDCWNTDNLPEDGVLDEVIVYSHDPNWHFTQGPGLGGGNNYNYQQYVNNATNGFATNGGGGTSLSYNQVTSAAAAILMAAPIEPDENGNCPDGYKKNPTTGKCESICSGGKFFNETTQECECPEGLVENSSGNCIKDCTNFEDVVSKVLKIEAGFVDDPTDPGGATNKGISWPVWKKNANNILGISPTLINLQNLTEYQAKKIYKKLYWDSIYADDIIDGDLRYMLFDFHVNSGGNAIKVLQKTLNQLGSSLAVDGIIGQQTINEINSFDNQIALYNTFKSNRKSYYNSITENSINKYIAKHPNASEAEIKSKTFKKFINGWINRANHFLDKSSTNFLYINC